MSFGSPLWHTDPPGSGTCLDPVYWRKLPVEDNLQLLCRILKLQAASFKRAN